MDRPSSMQADGLVFSVEPPPENSNDRHQRLSTTKKKALAPLLNEIANLKEEDLDVELGQANCLTRDFGHTAPATPHERIKDFTVIADDRLQNESAALFHQFEKRAHQVDEQLLNFSDAVRPLGSSVGLLSSSYNLRVRLQRIRHLFHENASEAFPNKIQKEPVAPPKPAFFRPITSDLEELPHQFELLARDFLHFLHNIPELTDEGLNANVLNFEADLKYWASCLKEFEGQSSSMAIKRYANSLTREMDTHLEAIRDSLISFVKDGALIGAFRSEDGTPAEAPIGVPMIKIARVDVQDELYLLSSVASLFSSIVVIMIQCIVDEVDTQLQHVVVALWRASVIFGLGSTITSLLAAWVPALILLLRKGRAAAYRSPRSAVPTFVSVLLTRTPLICLASSIIAFSAGLLCYAYSPFQGKLVATRAAVFDGLPILVGLSLNVQLAFKDVGSKRLEEIVGGWRERWIWVIKASSAGPRILAKRSTEILANLLRRLAPRAPRGSSSTGSDPDDTEKYSAGLPAPNTSQKAERMRRFSTVSGPEPIRVPSPPSLPQVSEIREIPSSPVRERAPWSKPGQDPRSPQDSPQDPPPPPMSPTPKISMLKALKPTQELIEHGGLARDLQFSRDGKWLATCSWDRKAIIWKVEANLLQHRVLTHPGAGLLSQVAWSPEGTYLLTRTFRHVKVWAAETGVLKQTISFKSKIEAVTWMPSGDSFICVEGSVVHIMDLQGNIKADHPFKRLDIHDVAPTHDEQRMILVATLQSSRDDLKPSKSRAENWIIVYHIGHKKVECQVPVLENVRNVTISSDRSNGYRALISYEDMAPPELWRMSVVHTEDREEARLQLLQTYMPTAAVEFAGLSYLGGTQDEFVICAGKKGDIYFWARETGLLLHTLQGANIVDNTPEDFTSVAWNHCETGRYMFASATNDGTVRIWTAQAPPDSQQPSHTGSPRPFGIRSSNLTIGQAV